MNQNGRARKELARILEDPGVGRGTVLRKLQSAANKRRKAAQMIAEASEDLAVWSKVGAELGIPMSEMTEQTEYSRELMYYLQREHGLGKARSA